MHPHRGAHSPGEPSQTRHGPTQPSFVERVRQLRKRVVGDTCHPPGLDLDAERGLAHLGHSKPPFLSLRTSCRIAFTSDGVACHITWVDPSGPEHLALRPALDDPALPDRLAPDLSVVPGHPRVSLVYLSMDLPLEGWTHRSASLRQAMSPYGSRRDRGARPPQPGLVGRRRRRLGRARAHELGLRAPSPGASGTCPVPDLWASTTRGGSSRPRGRSRTSSTCASRLFTATPSAPRSPTRASTWLSPSTAPRSGATRTSGSRRPRASCGRAGDWSSSATRTSRCSRSPTKTCRPPRRSSAITSGCTGSSGR